MNEQALAAAREEAVQAERERVSEIQSLGATAIKYGIDETVISEFIAKGVPVDQARKELFAHLATKGQQGVPPRTGAEGHRQSRFAPSGGSVTRDGMEQRLACMQMASAAARGWAVLPGAAPGPQRQRTRGVSRWLRSRAAAAGRRDGARVPQFQAHRHGEGGPGVARHQPARDGRDADCGAGAPGLLRADAEFFAGGAESTSDFPAILANVANKTLRQGYEAYPRTFQPFCRQVTAQDFKPINRVMLADAPVLAGAE